MKQGVLILAIGFLMSLTGFAQSDKYEKSMNETFKVSKNATLDIENKKGDIEIVIWDKNEVQIDVNILVICKDESKAQSILKAIEVEIIDTKDLINVETELDFSSFEHMDVKVDIDLTFKVPATINLEIDNKFGDVYIGEIKGNLDIEVSYGNLRLDKAMGAVNEIDIAFGKAFIGSVPSLNLDASNATTVDIDNVGVLVAETKFSSINVDKVKDLQVESQYDKWDVMYVVTADVETEFSSFKIGKLITSFNCEGAYGGVTVKHIMPEFKFINLEYSFGGVKLFFDEEADFDFDCTTVMGSCSYPTAKARIDKEKLNYTNYTYNGVFGSEENDSRVDIELSQGSITIDYR